MTWKWWWLTAGVFLTGLILVMLITQWTDHLERPIGPVIVLMLVGSMYLHAVLPTGRKVK